MIEIRALASSSAGNAYLVTDGRFPLLLDCGLSYRELEAEIEAEANGPVIDIEYAEAEEVVTDGEPEPEKNEKPAKATQKPPEKAQKGQKPKKEDPGQQTLDGPGF